MRIRIEASQRTDGPVHAGIRLRGLGLAAACLCIASAVHAADRQDPAELQAHAERFLKTQTSGLPGKVTIQVKPPRTAMPACSALDSFQPAGSRSIGKISVGVRCLAPTPWTVYLPAQVRVIGPYAVTRQPLPANHILTAADIALREGDLGSLSADVVTDADAMVGYRVVSGLAAGAPLRNALLRPPLAVQQGQTTRLVLNGPGFSVQSEGQALANASRGDRVRVKTPSGQVVSGIAHDGQQVVVTF
ncbi:MAG: flagellar basal body P-ring formation protein FlgA [Thiobacillus sp.]|nr:flagellar basal body P-ring formation protein FlgA [Thiobacillus sp.]